MKKSIVAVTGLAIVLQLPLVVVAQTPPEPMLMDAVQVQEQQRTGGPDGAAPVQVQGRLQEDGSIPKVQAREVGAQAVGVASMMQSGVLKRAQERKESMVMKREEFQNSAEQRREMLGERVGVERAERAEQGFGRVAQGYDNALDSLFAFADRIESRIEKMNEDGVDTTAVTSEITLLQGDLSEIATSLEVPKALWSELVGSDDPATSFVAIRKTMQEVMDSMQATRQDLVDLVQRLKTL